VFGAIGFWILANAKLLSWLSTRTDSGRFAEAAAEVNATIEAAITCSLDKNFLIIEFPPRHGD
jgi:hypothetical protein